MRFLGRTRPPTTNILEHMAPNVGFELIHLPSFLSSGHLCVWFEQVQLISHLSMGSRLNVLPLHHPPTKPTTCRTHGVTLTGLAPRAKGFDCPPEPLAELRQGDRSRLRHERLSRC